MDRHTAAEATDAAIVVVNEAARYVPFGEVTAVLGTITALVKLVKETIETYVETCETYQRIMSLADDLVVIQSDLNKLLQNDKYNNSCIRGFRNLKESLNFCISECKSYVKKKKAKKVFKGKYYLRKLASIENQLKSAVNYLQLALQLGMMYTQKEQRKDQQIIKSMLSSTRGEGACLTPEKYKLIPARPQNLSSILHETETTVTISWIDTNKKCDLNHYELILNSDIEQLFRFPTADLEPEEVKEISNSNTEKASRESTQLKYSVWFCPPILNEGQLYEVKVRAVNGKGPSDWSEEILFRYKLGHPKQPQIVSLDATCPNEVEIEVEVYERDSSIENILVAYVDINDPDTTVWQISKFPVKPTENTAEKVFLTTLKINGLKLSCYRFKVAVTNSCGRSPWSLTNDISEDSFPPGAPAEFYTYDYDDEMTGESLLLHWKEPNENPSHVHEYRIHYKEKEKDCNKWTHDVIPKNHDSHYDYSPLNLKKNTPYIFQIEAVNRVGKGGISKTEGQFPYEYPKKIDQKPLYRPVTLADMLRYPYKGEDSDDSDSDDSDSDDSNSDDDATVMMTRQ